MGQQLVFAGRRWLEAVILGCSLTAAVGCVTVETRPEVEVTAGAIPEEIRDARWESMPLRYCVVRSDSGFVQADRFSELVGEAFSTWGVDARDDGECRDVVQGDGRNEVGWGRPPESQPGGGVHQAGYTRLLYRPCTGEGCNGAQSRIVEADIVVHPEPAGSLRSEACLRATLAHEVGHFLGVPHLDSPALMAPVATECRADLTDADREALRRLYPERWLGISADGAWFEQAEGPPARRAFCLRTRRWAISRPS